MIHPIEAESFRILSAKFNPSNLTDLETSIAKRIIHATADFELADSLIFSPGSVERAVVSLEKHAVAICDVEMVRAGITKYPTICNLDKVHPSPTGFPTRSYTAMSLAAKEHPRNAIFVIGCAPTALMALTDLDGQDWFQPALIIGLPVGFVGAAESKEKLANTRFPHVTNVGNKGGSPAAAAAFNALRNQTIQGSKQ